jgi:hypothetical protein
MLRYAPVTSGGKIQTEYQYVLDQVMDVFGRIRGPFSILLHSPKLAEPCFQWCHSHAKSASLTRIAPDRHPNRGTRARRQLRLGGDVSRCVGLRDNVIDLLRAKGNPSDLPAEKRDIVLYIRRAPTGSIKRFLIRLRTDKACSGWSN